MAYKNFLKEVTLESSKNEKNHNEILDNNNYLARKAVKDASYLTTYFSYEKPSSLEKFIIK